VWSGVITAVLALAIVLGSAVEYTISEVADRNAGVAAKLRKERLTFK
jgi:hypothetical protein